MKSSTVARKCIEKSQNGEEIHLSCRCGETKWEGKSMLCTKTIKCCLIEGGEKVIDGVEVGGETESRGEVGAGSASGCDIVVVWRKR